MLMSLKFPVLLHLSPTIKDRLKLVAEPAITFCGVNGDAGVLGMVRQVEDFLPVDEVAFDVASRFVVVASVLTSGVGGGDGDLCGLYQTNDGCGGDGVGGLRVYQNVNPCKVAEDHHGGYDELGNEQVAPYRKGAAEEVGAGQAIVIEAGGQFFVLSFERGDALGELMQTVQQDQGGGCIWIIRHEGRMMGVEPTTTSSTVRCSAIELHSPYRVGARFELREGGKYVGEYGVSLRVCNSVARVGLEPTTYGYGFGGMGTKNFLDSLVSVEPLALCLRVCAVRGIIQEGRGIWEGMLFADAGDGGVQLWEGVGGEGLQVAAHLLGVFPSELFHQHFITGAIEGGEGGSGAAEGVGAEVGQSGAFGPGADDGAQTVAGHGFAGGVAADGDEYGVYAVEGVIVADGEPVIYVERGDQAKAFGLPFAAFGLNLQVGFFGEVQVVQGEVAEFGCAQTGIHGEGDDGEVAAAKVIGGEGFIQGVYFFGGEGALGFGGVAAEFVGQGGAVDAITPGEEGAGRTTGEVLGTVGPCFALHPFTQLRGGELVEASGEGVEELPEHVAVGLTGPVAVLTAIQKAVNFCLHDYSFGDVMVDVCEGSGMPEMTGNGHSEGARVCILDCMFLGGVCLAFSLRQGSEILAVTVYLSSAEVAMVTSQGVTGPEYWCGEWAGEEERPFPFFLMEMYE